MQFTYTKSLHARNIVNLLFVIDSLGSGGAQRQMVNLARGLKARGHDVELFTYYSENHYRHLLDEAGIPVHLHPKSSRFSLAPLIALRRFIRHGAYDIVLSFLDTPNFYTDMAGIGQNKTKIIVSERSSYPSCGLSFRLRNLQRCHRLADAITVNSHHQRYKMEQNFPWMERKIKTIYNGFDLDAFKPAVSFNTSGEILSLLVISSVSYNKNSLNLAKALSICKEKYQLEVHVDWIGTRYISPKVGTRPAEQTDAYLKESGISHLWNWLGERTDIPEMLASHDALIHPSYFEGLPNVVCEALACGCPVLVSGVCDHPVLVEEGVTGFLFDPGSTDDIAKTIFNFSQTAPLRRKSMGEAARKYAENHLSLDRCVSEYEQLFFSLISR